MVLAVRDFSDHRWDDKPANELVNAWSAGVPAIVGRESAFQAFRRSEEFTVERVGTQWIGFFEEVAFDRYRSKTRTG